MSQYDKAQLQAALYDPTDGKFNFLRLWENPAPAYVSEATYAYNCHAYAWYLNGDIHTNPVWINDENGNLGKYWDYTDGCYVEVDSESEADVVYYNWGDHSALKDPVYAGMYISKWGQFPLVRHAPNQTIYPDPDVREYYKYVYNFEINGPAGVSGSATYKLNATKAVEWKLYSSLSSSTGYTAYNGFTITPTAVSDSVTVTASSSAVGSVYLKAKINGWHWAWKEIKAGHQVAFDLNGSQGTPPASQTVVNNGYAVQPSPPVWSGYGPAKSFGGWYDNALCTGSPVNFATCPITSNITFYARWIASGIDFVVYNNSSHDLSGMYIELTGKIGSNSYNTTLIAADAGSLLSGNSKTCQTYNCGIDFSDPPNTAINSLFLSFYAGFSGSGNVTVSASVDGGSSGSSSKSVSSGGYFFDFNLNPGTTVPNAGARRVLSVYIY